VSHIDSVSSGLQADASDVRRKRLLFRCWHHGTQESDLILGPFAETWVAHFDSAQLDRFEALLDCTDPEVFDWIVVGIAPPPQHNHDVLRLVREFCTRRSRGREQIRQA